jgi:CheY-like chemotaxis protein
MLVRSGFTQLRRLPLRRGGRDLQGLTMKGDEEKARAAGGDGYVTKPHSPKQLVDLVGQLLAKS